MEFTVFIKYKTRRKELFYESKYSRPDDFFKLFDGSAFFAARSIMGQALLDFLDFNGSRVVQILEIKCGYKCGVLSDWFTDSFVT